MCAQNARAHLLGAKRPHIYEDWLLVLPSPHLLHFYKNVKVEVKMPKYTDYCFTYHLQHTPDQEDKRKPRWDKTTMLSLTYQTEICPTTQKEHFQGFIQFKIPYSIKDAQKQIGLGKVHLEQRCGSVQQAYNYCQKLDSRKPGSEPQHYNILGEPAWTHSRQPGQHWRVQVIQYHLKQGKCLQDLTDDPHVGDYAIGRIRADFQVCSPPQSYSGTRHSYAVYGPGGTGKSELIKGVAYRLQNKYNWSTYTYSNPSYDKIWFEDYRGEEIMLIHEYKGSFPFEYFKQLIDHGALSLPYKGGSRKSNIHLILIASNYPPCHWYKQELTDLPEFTRRVRNTYELTERSQQRTIAIDMYEDCKSNIRISASMPTVIDVFDGYDSDKSTD